MKKSRRSNNKSSKLSIGFIVLAVLYVVFIVCVVLWIPHLHLPSKQINNEETAGVEKPIPDGTVQNGGLWDFYKDKTLSEVKSLRPGIVDTGTGLFIFDQYGDSERAALFGGSYEDDKLANLSLVLSNSGSLCGTENEADKKVLSDFAVWGIDRMGLSIDEMEYMETGDFAYYTDYVAGVRCGYYICPGSDGIPLLGCADISAVAEFEGW